MEQEDSNGQDASQAPSGILYLIPVTLGEIAPLEVLPISIKRVVEQTDEYIVENEKSARHFIKKISSGKSQNSLILHQLNKFTQPDEIPDFLQACREGRHVGILSEAGCPGIADPGSEVVRLAHGEGIRVVPLVGPSSILLALMGSGLNGQQFSFHGYLPIGNEERRKAIRTLEKESRGSGYAQIFMETPYRNDKLFLELRKTLHSSTSLCIASDVTLESEYLVTRTIKEWQLYPLELHKKPTIFIIQAEAVEF